MHQYKYGGCLHGCGYKCANFRAKCIHLFSVQLMLNVTFPGPIIYEVYKHVSPLPLPLVPPTYIYHKYLRGWMVEVNICPMWKCQWLIPYSQRAVDRAPNHFVWDARLYRGCCLISWPDMNMAALNMYSHRIRLFLQVSRMLERTKETNFFQPGGKVALWPVIRIKYSAWHPIYS